MKPEDFSCMSCDALHDERASQLVFDVWGLNGVLAAHPRAGVLNAVMCSLVWDWDLGANRLTGGW